MYDNTEEMDKLSTSLPDFEESILTPEASAHPGPSTSPGSSTTSSSMPNYSKDEFQRILKAVLEARTPAIAASLLKDPRERPLKARLPDVYRGKIHLEYYNFCQQCKNHFATAGAKALNRIFFVTLFFWD